MALLRLSLLLSSALLLSACSHAGYILETSLGQWRLMNRARPVSEVLASPYVSEKTKRAILLVQEAKKFASDTLGLKATRSYENFVQLDAPFVSWAVSASLPYKLEEKKWKFPIVGELPYIGYFKKEKAEKFAEEVKKEASPPYDVWVRGVPAFSSLGWFPDPLYSSMIEKSSDLDIVNVVVHESLHATVWVGDSVDFNEKLANFVGLEGSLRFVKTRNGDGSAYRAALAEVAGEKIFAEFMHESMERFKREIEPKLTDVSTRDSIKKKFYEDLPRDFERFFAGKKKPGNDALKPDVKFKDWNNAALLAYGNYYSDMSVFEKALAACGGDLRRFVGWIDGQKKESAFKSAPEDHLRSLLKEGAACP